MSVRQRTGIGRAAPGWVLTLAIAAGVPALARAQAPVPAEAPGWQKEIAAFEAKDRDYQSATQRIFRSARYPSHIEVSVVEP